MSFRFFFINQATTGIYTSLPPRSLTDALPILDVAHRRPRGRALNQQVGGDDRPPAAAARRIEEAADEAERLDHLGLALLRRIAPAAIDEIEPDRDQIGEDEGLRGIGMDIGDRKSVV